MANNFSDYLEDQLVKHIFRTGSFTKPVSLYIALCTTTPTDADTGSTIVEPSGGSYARVALNPLDANWAATSGTNGTTSNSSAITFPTASSSWGTITGVAICDALTTGNMLFWGALSSNKVVDTGDVFQFATNQLSIVLN